MPLDFSIQNGPGLMVQNVVATPAQVLTVDRFASMVGGNNPDWKEAACVLIKDPQDWPTKEKLVLQVLTQQPHLGPPWEALANLIPFLALPTSNGETRLVKFYAAMGELLKRSKMGYGEDSNILAELSYVQREEAWTYFTQARETINQKLTAVNKARFSPYQLLVEDDASDSNRTTFNIFSGHYPRSIATDDLWWTHSVHYPPVTLKEDKVLVPHTMKRLHFGVIQSSILRSLIARYGVGGPSKDGCENNSEQWLIIALKRSPATAENIIVPVAPQAVFENKKNNEINVVRQRIPICWLDCQQSLMLTPQDKLAVSSCLMNDLVNLVMQAGYTVMASQSKINCLVLMNQKLSVPFFPEILGRTDQKNEKNERLNAENNEIICRCVSNANRYFDSPALGPNISPATVRNLIRDLRKLGSELRKQRQLSLAWVKAQPNDILPNLFASLGLLDSPTKDIRSRYIRAVEWLKTDGSLKRNHRYFHSIYSLTKIDDQPSTPKNSRP